MSEYILPKLLTQKKDNNQNVPLNEVFMNENLKEVINDKLMMLVIINQC